MNPLDYFLIASLIGFLIYGYMKGFVRQVLLLIAIGLSFFLAARYHADLAAADLMGGLREKSESVALVSAFVGILFVAAALTSIAVTFVSRKMKNKEFSAGDRWLGALMGLLVGVILLGGFAVGLKEWQSPDGAIGTTIPKDVQNQAEGLVAESVLIPKLADACLALVNLIPQDGQDELLEEYERIRRTPAGSKVATPLGHSLTAPSGQETGEAPKPRTDGRMLNLGAQRALARKLESEKSSTPAADTDAATLGEPTPAAAKVDDEKAEPVPAVAK